MEVPFLSTDEHFWRWYSRRYFQQLWRRFGLHLDPPLKIVINIKIFGISNRIGGDLVCVVQQLIILLLQAFAYQIWIDLTVLEHLLGKYHGTDVSRNNATGQWYLGGFPTISLGLVGWSAVDIVIFCGLDWWLLIEDFRNCLLRQKLYTYIVRTRSTVLHWNNWVLF